MTRLIQSIAFIAAIALLAAPAHADVVLMADDFDGGATGAALNPNGAMTITSVANPSGTGNVGQIDLNGNNQWNSVTDINFALPADTVAGTDTLDFTFDVYVPTTVAGGTAIGSGDGSGAISDSFGALVRWNGTQPDAFPPSGSTNVGSGGLPFDTWVTVGFTGATIAALDNTDSSPVTSFTPILSVRDRVQDGTAGTIAYIDNINISVTTSAVPEPTSLAVLGLFSIAGVVRRRRR